MPDDLWTMKNNNWLYKKNNLHIIALKFSIFANYNLNVYFLWITTTKVSKFAGSGQNTKFRPF